MPSNKSFNRSKNTLREFDGSVHHDKSNGSHGSASLDLDTNTSGNGVDGATGSLAVPASSPTHLLLVALLEHLCSMYVSDRERSQELFKVLCSQLINIGVMSPVGAMDEIAAIRTQYVTGFSNLIKSAMATINLSNRGVGGKVVNGRNLRLFLPGSSLPPSIDVLSTDIFSFHTSRYQQEFIEERSLGRGAYGIVYRARHKLDGCQYAVKKIAFYRNSPDVWLKVIREVKCLAAVKHRNVVRYHGAWLEYDVQLLDYIEDNRGSMMPITYEPTDRNDDDSLDIVFESSEAPSGGNENSNAKNLTNSMEDHDLSVDPSSNNGEISLKPKVLLYIQMELCANTLKDWISQRNSLLKSSTSDIYSVVDIVSNIRILKQTFQAVSQIHAAGLIHRDLKPKNIFLSIGSQGQLEVKVGDFGLARFQDVNEPPTPGPGLCREDSSDNNGLYTGGVGTTIYAAPEQLEGIYYNSKCDMYSLGVLLFEMYQPFKTEMERLSCLKYLAKNGPPKEFCDRWPKEASYIEKMLKIDPEDRPSANEMLNGELFCTKDQMIQHLRVQLEQSTLNIENLNQELKSKDSQLLNQKQQLESKEQEILTLKAELELMKLHVQQNRQFVPNRDNENAVGDGIDRMKLS